MGKKTFSKNDREKKERIVSIDVYLSDYFMSTLANKLLKERRIHVLQKKVGGIKMTKDMSAEELYKNGCKYYKGDGVPVDKERALLLFEQAAQLGYAEAQADCSAMYYDGEGTEADFEKAFYWTEKVAQQGDADAQRALGVAYYRGDGTEIDSKRRCTGLKKPQSRETIVRRTVVAICITREP